MAWQGLRFTSFERFPQVELALVIVIAYASYVLSILPCSLSLRMPRLSYLICETALLSGIVAIFFCGVFFAHLGEGNLSSESQVPVF